MDFNKLNNNPDNIRRMHWKKHWKTHYNFTSQKHKNDAEYRRKLSEGRKKFWDSDKNRQDYSKRMTERNLKNWKKKDYREQMKITLSEAKNLEKLSKACSNDPVVMLAEIGSKWIIDEGVPMLDEKTAKAEVSDTPLEVVMDLVNAFNSVNNIGQAEKN